MPTRTDIAHSIAYLHEGASILDKLIEQGNSIPLAKWGNEHQRFQALSEVAQENIIRLRDALNTARSRTQPNVLTPGWKGIMDAFPTIQYRFPETLDRPIPLPTHWKHSYGPEFTRVKISAGAPAKVGTLAKSMPDLTQDQAFVLAAAIDAQRWDAHARAVGMAMEEMASMLKGVGADVSWTPSYMQPSTATPPGASMLATSNTGRPTEGGSGSGAALLLLALFIGLAFVASGRAR